eukprot:5310598-Pyramimonas_sp.AAC.1
MSSVSVLQLEVCAEIQSFCQDDWNNTNSFADLARLGDRVQTSALNRRTRLIILHALALLTSSLAALELELCSENVSVYQDD